MQPTVYRQIHRTDASTLSDLARFGVATVHEAQQRRGLCAPRLRPIRDGWRIAGSAITSLNHPGDNLMVHTALSLCQRGDVLVIASTVACNAGMLGDLLGQQAARIGLAGIIVDTGIRDVAELREMGIPIWTSAITAAGCVKETPGWVNVPVVCGDQVINPGDIIVADDDGVVAVPATSAKSVIQAATQREAKEAVARSAYRDGESSYERNGLDARLANHGVKVIDGAWPDAN